MWFFSETRTRSDRNGTTEKSVARFRKKIPFLALIPPTIYRRLSPLEWHEPFGEIAKAREELEEQLDS
jgi:hypothetical protein